MKDLLLERPEAQDLGVRRAARWFSAAIAFSLYCFGLLFAFVSLDYHWNWSSVFGYGEKFLDGWLTTLWISIATLFASTTIGLACAAARNSGILPLRYTIDIYVEITRGTPLLVQILIYYYVFADAVGLQNRYVAGVIIMSLFSGAYLAEIFRSGMTAVGKSQLASASAIGLNSWQTLRYVVFPQAIRYSMPAIAGQFANLIKDSSLLSIIAISEFTLNAQEVNALTSSPFESYFPLAVGYLLLTIPIMQLSRILEKKLKYNT